MTEKQQRVLDTIKQYKKEHGYEPSKMELSTLVKLSRVTIDAVFDEFDKQNIIKYKPKGANYFLSTP